MLRFVRIYHVLVFYSCFFSLTMYFVNIGERLDTKRSFQSQQRE